MIGLVYTVVLFMIVPLVSTLDGMDDSLIEAGYNLGGSRFTVLRRIVIPYAMPGIVAGCIIVFMLTAGSYLTPILLGGKNSMWFTAADLQPVHHPLQLGGRRDLRRAAARLHLARRLARPAADRAEPRDHGGAELSDERRRAAGRRCCAGPTAATSLAFFVYLAAPLAAAASSPSTTRCSRRCRGSGFTLDWFFNDTEPKLGMFHDRRLHAGPGELVLHRRRSSRRCRSRSAPATPSCSSGGTFRGKAALYILMIVPLVIPGVILGISILVFASTIANGVEAATRHRARLPAARAVPGRARAVLVPRRRSPR